MKLIQQEDHSPIASPHNLQRDVIINSDSNATTDNKNNNNNNTNNDVHYQLEVVKYLRSISNNNPLGKKEALLSLQNHHNIYSYPHPEYPHLILLHYDVSILPEYPAINDSILIYILPLSIL